MDEGVGGPKYSAIFYLLPSILVVDSLRAPSRAVYSSHWPGDA